MNKFEITWPDDEVTVEEFEAETVTQFIACRPGSTLPLNAGFKVRLVDERVLPTAVVSTPADPVEPPADPVEPPADPVEPPADPVEPPALPV